MNELDWIVHYPVWMRSEHLAARRNAEEAPKADNWKENAVVE